MRADRLQHLAAVLSVSLLSARMLLEAVAPSLDALGAQNAAAKGGEPPTPTASALRAIVLYRPLRRSWLHASSQPRREAVAWLLAVVSLQSQRARGFRLPLYLRLPFLPALGVEAMLRNLANRLTAAGFPGRRPPPQGKGRATGRGPSWRAFFGKPTSSTEAAE